MNLIDYKLQTMHLVQIKPTFIGWWRRAYKTDNSPYNNIKVTREQVVRLIVGTELVFPNPLYVEIRNDKYLGMIAFYSGDQYFGIDSKTVHSHPDFFDHIEVLDADV